MIRKYTNSAKEVKSQKEYFLSEEVIPDQLRISFSSNPTNIILDRDYKAADFFRKIWDKDLMNIQEQVYVIFMDRKMEVIGWRCVATGTQGCVTMDVKLIVAMALKCMASRLFIAHNHPSGSLKVSEADDRLSRHLSQSLSYFTIELLQSFIMTNHAYNTF